MKKILKHVMLGILLCICTSLSAEVAVRISAKTPVTTAPVIRYTLLWRYVVDELWNEVSFKNPITRIIGFIPGMKCEFKICAVTEFGSGPYCKPVIKTLPQDGFELRFELTCPEPPGQPKKSYHSSFIDEIFNFNIVRKETKIPYKQEE